MSVISCERNEGLRRQIQSFADVLRTQAHTLGNHGLNAAKSHNSGLFRGVIELLCWPVRRFDARQSRIRVTT